MKTIRTLILTLAAVSVSACAGPQMASRNATVSGPGSISALSAPQASAQDAQVVLAPLENIKIANVSVEVPRSLTVSEKNSYFPRGDIVWRGDTFGDRHEQVKAILETSAKNVASELNGARGVNLSIRVTRFHGLSEKARYSTGGVHNMNFIVTVTDAKTGALLRASREVITNLDAFGGSAAVAADQRGETQKVRVTGFLTNAIRAELTRPGGYQDSNSGFFVALNRS